MGFAEKFRLFAHAVRSCCAVGEFSSSSSAVRDVTALEIIEFVAALISKAQPGQRGSQEHRVLQELSGQYHLWSAGIIR